MRHSRTVTVVVTVDHDDTYTPTVEDVVLDLWGSIDGTHDRELPGWGYVELRAGAVSINYETGLTREVTR